MNLLEIAFIYKVNYNFVELMCFHCTLCLSCSFSCEFVYIILNSKVNGLNPGVSVVRVVFSESSSQSHHG